MTTAISELKQRYALLEPSPSLQRRTRAMMHAVRKRRGSKRHSLRRAGASVAILCVLLLLLVGGLIGTRSLPADYTMQLRAGGDGGRPGFGALPVGSTLSEPIENTPSEPVENTPSEPVENTPSEPVENTPSEPVENTPSEPAASMPPKPAGNMSSGSASDAPAGLSSLSCRTGDRFIELRDLSINALYHSDAGDGITIVVDYAVYEREAGQPGHALSYFAVSAEGEPYDAQYLYGQPKTTDGWTSALQSCHLTFAKDEPLPETLLFAPFAGDQLLLEPDARMEAQREALALLSPQDCFSIRLKKPCTLLSPAQLP